MKILQTPDFLNGKKRGRRNDDVSALVCIAMHVAQPEWRQISNQRQRSREQTARFARQMPPWSSWWTVFRKSFRTMEAFSAWDTHILSAHCLPSAVPACCVSPPFGLGMLWSDTGRLKSAPDPLAKSGGAAEWHLINHLVLSILKLFLVKLL